MRAALDGRRSQARLSLRLQPSKDRDRQSNDIVGGRRVPSRRLANGTLAHLTVVVVVFALAVAVVVSVIVIGVAMAVVGIVVVVVVVVAATTKSCDVPVSAVSE